MKTMVNDKCVSCKRNDGIVCYNNVDEKIGEIDPVR